MAIATSLVAEARLALLRPYVQGFYGRKAMRPARKELQEKVLCRTKKVRHKNSEHDYDQSQSQCCSHRSAGFVYGSRLGCLAIIVPFSPAPSLGLEAEGDLLRQRRYFCDDYTAN